MNGDPRMLLAVGSLRGQVDDLKQLVESRDELGFDGIAVVGDLAGDDGPRATQYRTMFEALGAADMPAFWVPGPGDAPAQALLREAHNMEVLFGQIHGVHGTYALGRHVLFAGMGGEIVDDPDAEREEHAALRYPGWEVEYRLKAIREFDEHQKTFLFATPPAHKGRQEPGSEVLAELINTYRPRVVVAGGDEARSETLGTSFVVAPGAGGAVLVDLHEQKVKEPRARS